MNNEADDVALVWFKNDLRIHDNNVLKQALDNHKSVIGLYCFDDKIFDSNELGIRKLEVYRAKFLLESLHNLRKNLSDLFVPLEVSLKEPIAVIKLLAKKYDIKCVYTQEVWTRDEFSALEKVKTLKELKIITLYNQLLYDPPQIYKLTDEIPLIFTSFRKKIEKFVCVKEVLNLPQKARKHIAIDVNPIPTLKELEYDEIRIPINTNFPFKGGEDSGLDRLAYYFFESRKVDNYKETRNELKGVDHSTKFSPWLANGCLSPKMIYFQLKNYEKAWGQNPSTYWVFFELLWRDFFKYTAMQYRNKFFYSGGILNKRIQWNKDVKTIKDWINGTTGVDFIDANMQELKQTGWMSNRGRQNVASYFTKDIQQDWRIGAMYFESMLIDYDVHSNYGNWMYMAGVGNDPINRRFNIRSQAERYDPDRGYVTDWIK